MVIGVDGETMTVSMRAVSGRGAQKGGHSSSIIGGHDGLHLLSIPYSTLSICPVAHASILLPVAG